jgi:hypothetical protein
VLGLFVIFKNNILKKKMVTTHKQMIKIIIKFISKNKNHEKIILALAIWLIFTTSCKKEVTTKEETVIHSDGTVTSELDTDVDYVLDLDNSEREYRQAENDVADAVKRGDAAAEKTAREASAKAKSAWKARKLQ